MNESYGNMVIKLVWLSTPCHHTTPIRFILVGKCVYSLLHS